MGLRTEYYDNFPIRLYQIFLEKIIDFFTLGPFCESRARADTLVQNL